MRGLRMQVQNFRAYQNCRMGNSSVSSDLVLTSGAGLIAAANPVGGAVAGGILVGNY